MDLFFNKDSVVSRRPLFSLIEIDFYFNLIIFLCIYLLNKSDAVQIMPLARFLILNSLVTFSDSATFIPIN